MRCLIEFDQTTNLSTSFFGVADSDTNPDIVDLDPPEFGYFYNDAGTVRDATEAEINSGNYDKKRLHAYGPAGDEFDMLYKAVKQLAGPSPTGDVAVLLDHVESVKALYPKP